MGGYHRFDGWLMAAGAQNLSGTVSRGVGCERCDACLMKKSVRKVKQQPIVRGTPASEKPIALGIDTVGDLARADAGLPQSDFGRSYAAWLVN